jgi:CRP-like cAMP-binding protein
VIVCLPARKGDIASWLNLTHEHFSRILHELATAGFIEVTGSQVLIRDVQRLRGVYKH